MRKPEQRLWDRMRNALKDEFYLERVENGVAAGRPDVDVMWHGIVVPVELKAVTEYPKRPTTPVLGADGLNQNQKNWWLTWRHRGGRGLFLIGVDVDIYCLPSNLSEYLNNFNEEALRAFRSDWPNVINLVKNTATSICKQNR